MILVWKDAAMPNVSVTSAGFQKNFGRYREAPIREAARSPITTSITFDAAVKSFNLKDRQKCRAIPADVSAEKCDTSLMRYRYDSCCATVSTARSTPARPFCPGLLSRWKALK